MSIDLDDCIEWDGLRTHQGYGTLWDPVRERMVYAHREAWEQEHGPIPEDTLVIHMCQNPPCVNVQHLRLGERRDVRPFMARPPHHKLDPAAVRAIRKATGTNGEVGERFGVSDCTVSLIRRGKIWKGVA